MRNNFIFIFLVSLVVFLISSCQDDSCMGPFCSNPEFINPQEAEFGGGYGYKLPVPPGYDWEVTQSWAEHCQECNEKYHDWDYCSISHMDSCCKYAWDFNLPGIADKGKPVLSSSDGEVKTVGYNSGWGNYVVVDHGSRCSRYAHLLDNSTDHLEEGDFACQGFKIGEVGDSGNSYGYHLHFQFESCDAPGISIPRTFTDGNWVPKCTRGADVYDSSGNYSFLVLSNTIKYECDGEELQIAGSLSDDGWFEADCGSLPYCPLSANCGRSTNHQFTDQSSLTSDVAKAAAYLYSECALDGKSDGGVHPNDYLTRAEALKISMFLFGLMFNCDAIESFADVSPGDWYYQTVVCAVSWDILDTSHTYFYPNNEVNFIEAAKMIVETASKWDIIEIKNPSQGHFNNIPKSHWGYKYVETLYLYGGLNDSHVNYSPDSKIRRKDYIVMAASMSSCYCANVICESPCVCDQATFACIDTNDNTPGSDGGSNLTPPPSVGGKEFDLDITCNVGTSNTQCQGTSPLFPINCHITNNGQTAVKIYDLVFSMTDSADHSCCQIVDSSLDELSSTADLSPGGTRHFTGFYEILCTSTPPDGEIEVSFDLTEDLYGHTTTYTDLLQTSIIVNDEMFEVCIAPSPPPPPPSGGTTGGWICDPAVGYLIYLNSLNASVEALGVGSGGYFEGVPDTGLGVHVKFNCEDLSGVMLIDASHDIMLSTANPNLPPFAVWRNYSGILTLNPPSPPDEITDYFIGAPQTILVRIPALD